MCVFYKISEIGLESSAGHAGPLCACQDSALEEALPEPEVLRACFADTPCSCEVVCVSLFPNGPKSLKGKD